MRQFQRWPARMTSSIGAGCSRSPSTWWCSWLIPPHAGCEAEGQRRQDRHGPGETRQLFLHASSPRSVPQDRYRQPGGLAMTELRGPWLCVPVSRRVCPGRVGPRRASLALECSATSGGPEGLGLRGTGAGVLCGEVSRAPSRMALAMTTAIPSEISTSPMLNTFANGTPAGARRCRSTARARATRRRRCSSSRDGPTCPGRPGPPAEAGMNPPLATIASRLLSAPAATSTRPGRRTLRSTTASTSAVEPT